jgi:cobalt-zinc-cadmium efflux system outer membrane protein
MRKAVWIRGGLVLSIWLHTAGALAESGPTVLEESLEASLSAEDERLPEGALSLQEAQTLALRRSPELASVAWEVRTRQGRAAQAGARPNPELDLQVEDFGGSGELGGTNAAESTLALSQTLETRGKRPKRRRAAEMDTEVARCEYELARRRVAAEVTAAFVAVQAAQQRAALSEELVQVAEASGAAANRLVEAGATPAVERTRAAVEAGLARVEVASARRALAAARVALAVTWGSATANFERAAGELGEIESPESLEALLARVADHPALQRWDRELARRESIVELEDAQRMPNLVARAGVRRLEESDDSAFVASVSMPFPIFDRNQGSRDAARSDVRRGAFERRAAEVQLKSQITAAYQELLSRYGEVSELRSTESAEGFSRACSATWTCSMRSAGSSSSACARSTLCAPITRRAHAWSSSPVPHPPFRLREEPTHDRCAAHERGSLALSRARDSGSARLQLGIRCGNERAARGARRRACGRACAG